MGSFTKHCAFFASTLTYFLKVTGCCGTYCFSQVFAAILRDL